MTRFALFALVAAAATFVAATPLKTPTEHRRAGNFPSIPGDNGSCQKVNELCAATIADPSTADRGLLGKSKECTLNAICWTLYGSEYDVDSWLEGHYGETAPASKDTARWPLEVRVMVYRCFARLMELQYSNIRRCSHQERRWRRSSRSSTPTSVFWPLSTGPSPSKSSLFGAVHIYLSARSASYVINIWTSLSAWTGFCATKEIPYNNLADWVSLDYCNSWSHNTYALFQFQWSSTVDAPKTC